MYHYILRVSSDSERLTANETVLSRLNFFNGRRAYLLFDGGDESEKRFIFVSEKKVTKSTLTEVKGIFEATVSLEEIDSQKMDGSLLEKIRIAKTLMFDDDYSGKQEARFCTESASQWSEGVETMTGFAKYKDFLVNFSDYIDRTGNLRAKGLYNVVFVNDSGASLDAHIDLLYRLYALKGLLTEYVMIKGDKDDAWHTDKETRFVYVIEDEWKTDSGEVHFRASNEVKLLQKIRRSSNIYVTSMRQEEYGKISMLDSFKAAFANVVIIDELSMEEKAAYICALAEEYGFKVDTEGFLVSKTLRTMGIDKIEASVRSAIQQKLLAKDSSFSLAVSDIGRKERRKLKSSAFDELEALIGLSGVKACVREIVTFLRKRGRAAVPCLHMAFLGNPGTGKTTVARILARIFAETGITEKNLLVETDRGGLVGLYVGHTADKTARKIESAMGGVLFIDEAYALYTGDRIDYGNEAVATLVKAMEDKRDEFVCILAGYTKETNAMLDMNPGLRDRIQFYIDFPDYSEAELMQIFEKLCKDNKYRVSDTAKSVLNTAFACMLTAGSENFSNGRLVRKIFERVRMKQALRSSNNIITEVDVLAVLDEKDIAVLCTKSNQSRIGFSA